MSRTRVAKLLSGYRNRAAADMNAICLTLLKVSQLLIDIPEINELDINPLFADERGVLALDARVRVQPAVLPGAERLAIRPYPQELEEQIKFDEDTILLRPIRPKDESQHRGFLNNLDREDARFRFFASVRELPHSELARYTQIDFDREMAFIATRTNTQDWAETLGVVRSVTDPDNVQAEIAIIVRSDLKGKGLGRILLDKMIDYCRSRGTRVLVGETLQVNDRMLALASKAGFEVRPKDDGGTVELRLDLT